MASAEGDLYTGGLNVEFRARYLGESLVR